MSFKQGFISLSHARLTQGCSDVSISSIPATIKPEFSVRIATDPTDSVSFVPVSQKDKTSKQPIVFFGPFPSTHLRNAQKNFSEAMSLVARLAEIKIQLQRSLLNAEKDSE